MEGLSHGRLIGVELLAYKLRWQMLLETSSQKRSKIAKRLKVTESFVRSGNKPE